jgi:REP element-mobilizing transposase RayT
MTPNPPRRISLRLPDFDYSQEGAYFITIGVKGRTSLFGHIVDGEMNLNEYGKIVTATWNDLAFYYPAIKLDAFIVMPNHVHGIIVITGAKTGGETPPLQKPTLGQIMGYYKYQSTNRIKASMKTAGSAIWQRGYYEHVIRDDKSLNRIQEYIIGNPQRWHLDRENPQAQGKDGFDSWLASIQGRPDQIMQKPGE